MNFIVFALLLSLAGPLFLMPVEKILPYPYLVEEAVKLAVVCLILKAKPSKNAFWFLVIFAGLLFSFSETIFYLTNIFTLGKFGLFPQRLVLTSFLHSGTTFLIAFFGKKGGWWWVTGFLGAVLIHGIYNLLVFSF